MATTVNAVTSHSAGGLNFLHLKLTAGGADSSVTYTLGGVVPTPPIVLGTFVTKTTGAAGANNITYVESTGVLTVSCSANDVLRVTVVY